MRGEILAPAPALNFWKMGLALLGSALSSVGAFALSQYLTARGLVSIPLARILLLITWVCIAALIVFAVKAFEVRRGRIIMFGGITISALLLGGLETWATLRSRAAPIDDKEFLDAVTA